MCGSWFFDGRILSRESTISVLVCSGNEAQTHLSYSSRSFPVAVRSHSAERVTTWPGFGEEPAIAQFSDRKLPNRME